MKRLLTLLVAAAAAGPALAQHHGHSAPPPAPPQQRQTPTDPHAGHALPVQPAPAPAPQQDPHAGHSMPGEPGPPTESHRGHDVGTAPVADPHAGHQMGASAEAAAPPVGPPPAEALRGPPHAADAVYGVEPMADAREDLRRTHGDLRTWRFLIDRLEVNLRNGRDGYAWEDVQFWYGGDIDRLWIKSQGEGRFGEGLESAEVQALWSRAISPWFDFQAGLRYDIRPQPDRAYLVIGVQGLAPYWFEIDAAAFLSPEGDFSARLEAEYDQRITQRLILQPRAELDLALQDVPELGIGSGVATAEAGLRLRYEIVPEFAPYVGVQYERAFGDTADFRRLAGEEAGGWSLVAGVRAWF